MSTNFQGKLIVITGGASGIGLATAHLLCSRGAHVYIADLNPDALNSAVSAITSSSLSASASISGTVVNVRSRSSVESWISDIVSQHGKLDGAVNLAGVIGKQIGVANIEEVEDDDWEFVLGVNLGGVLNCMRAELPVMREKEGEKVGGSIVNASSIAGLIGIVSYKKAQRRGLLMRYDRLRMRRMLQVNMLSLDLQGRRRRSRALGA